ncbi:SusC/RagA family TonB-linked outer membrane protein [Rubrolithibacter danxiaensis]|uniref:SusC/RagA family TonB-linked outer membrane protein n=1 Tax=Rubrolithibacter danxiaensis TaxID=3390805 RepID=UPI003BF82478
MKRLLSILVLTLFFCVSSKAQDRLLSGVVTDVKDNSGILSATVKLKGGSAITKTESGGAFRLSIPSGKVTLQISSVGYESREVTVGPNENNIRVSLTASTQQLNEVVVTALGISKNARKVGYAVTTVGGNDLSQARENNIANGLSGRVAGLKVSSTSSGPGGTSKVLLRGLPSMSQTGGPLYVINGIPMDNSQRGSSGEWGGADNGDGIGNLNPDDIESISVLKGQAASALYGARATYGAIVITTKKGKRGGIGVEYNLNSMFDQAINSTDFQYEYGQGQNGQKPGDALEARNTNRVSWGAKLDGSQVIGFNGEMYPYSAVKDNIETFYRTGSSMTNTLALYGGSDKNLFRLSLSNLDNESIIRNSGISRKTANLNVEQKLTDKLKANVFVNYIDEKSKARPQLSDGPMNANNFLFLASNVNQQIFAPGYDNTTGFETQFSDDEFVSNPWFVVNQYVNDLSRKRWITSGSLRYDFTKWLYAQGRVGYDIFNDRLLKAEPWGTAYTEDKHGNLQDLANSQQYELNLDGLIGISKDLTKDISLDAAIGGNIRKNQYEKTRVAGSYFLIPYQYSLSNVRSPNTNPNDNYDFWRTEVQSAYYTLDFNFRKYLTLSTTGRYDALSTLPENNNTVFAPSVSASFIFSELANLKKLDFGKLRISYAQTSGDFPDPYKTSLYYSLSSPLGNTPVGNFSTDLPNFLLKPFITTEFEVGTELRTLNSRLNLDIAWYNKKTKNEIMPATYSIYTGGTSGFVGTGSTQNKGLEVQIAGTPVKSQNFKWVSTFNFTTIANKVLETDADGKNQNLGTNRGVLGNALTAFVKGAAGPQILAYDYKRSASGEIIVDDAGLPVRGDLIQMGSVLPKYYGGWNNEFNYKGFGLSFLIDYNYGNKILSATEYYSIRRGLNKMTLEGRDGVTVGVHADGTPNTVKADPQAYYTALANNITSTSVVDGDFIKLRQATLGYTLSPAIVSKLKIFSSVQISLVGRNLAVLMRKSKNIDPEASFASNIRYYGIEGTSLPSARSYGFNLNFKLK